MGVEFVRDVPDMFSDELRAGTAFTVAVPDRPVNRVSYFDDINVLRRFLEQRKGSLLQYILHRNSNMHSRRYL